MGIRIIKCRHYRKDFTMKSRNPHNLASDVKYANCLYFRFIIVYSYKKFQHLITNDDSVTIVVKSSLWKVVMTVVFITEALLEWGWGGVSHPLSLKFRGQLSLIPKIAETVIPKTTYLVIPKTILVIPYPLSLIPYPYPLSLIPYPYNYLVSYPLSLKLFSQ